MTRLDTITVHDLITVGDHEKRVLNPAETVAAQEKQQAIIQAFQRWVWEDGARTDELCARYNERFNATRMRVYDGSHLSFPGIAAHLLRDGDLAAYQKRVVSLILRDGHLDKTNKSSRLRPLLCFFELLSLAHGWDSMLNPGDFGCGHPDDEARNSEEMASFSLP